MTRVLILGGVGFIGRNLVKRIVDDDAFDFVRVADKAMPLLSFFTAEFKEAFDSEKVQYVQCDLARDGKLMFVRLVCLL